MGEWDFYCALCGSPFLIEGFLPPADYQYPDPGSDVQAEESGNDDADDDENYLDKSVIGEEQLNWLTQLRLIAEDTASADLKRCFITGLGAPTMYGWAEVERNGSSWGAPTYVDYTNGEQVSAIPVHDVCMKMLAKILEFERVSTPLDVDLLYSALCSRRNDGNCDLDIRYYEFDDQHDQYWAAQQTWEPWLTDPLAMPGLDSFAHNLPRVDLTRDLTGSVETTASSPQTSASDPFSDLPIEVLQYIYDCLPADSIRPFMLASRPAYKVTKSSYFWKQRLGIDMPYLWEIHEVSVGRSDDIDWHEVYVRMSFQSYPGGWDRLRWLDHKRRSPAGLRYEPRSKLRENLDLSRFDPALLGVASRRRVYHCIKQVSDLYVLRTQQAEKIHGLNATGQHITASATCLYMPRVAAPFPKDILSMQTFVLGEWSDIQAQGKKLVMQYNMDGFLCYLSMAIGDHEYDFGIKSSGVAAKTTVVRLDASQWLEGLKLTISGRQDMPESLMDCGITEVEVWTHSSTNAERTYLDGQGNKRLLVPEPGHALVGFKGDCGDGRIYRLGLIEAPVDLHFARTPCVDALTRKFLWAKELPPPHISVHQGSPFENLHDLDLSPMQALCFGTQHGEHLDWHPTPSKIVEFAGGCDGQSLQFTWERSADPAHSDRFTEKMGDQTDQLKHFPIDGPGGERINGLVCQSAGGQGQNGRTSIRVVTNRDRQVVFGSRPIAGTAYETVPPLGKIVAGIFASFKKHSRSDKARCKAIGALVADGSYSQPHYQAVLDEHQRPWEPCPPPPSWTTDGERSFGGGLYLENGHPDQMLTFLDLAEPIRSISGLLAAPEDVNVLHLGGFQITYANGSVCWIGNTTPYPPGLVSEKEANRMANMTMSFGGCDSNSGAHTTSEEAKAQNAGPGKLWLVDDGDGELIAKVSIWAAEYLNGVQFETVSGKVSPRWGKAAGPATAVFEASKAVAEGSSGKDTKMSGPEETEAAARPVTVRDCIGIGFLLGGWRARLSAPDPRPLGVRAFKLRHDDSLT